MSKIATETLTKLSIEGKLRESFSYYFIRFINMQWLNLSLPTPKPKKSRFIRGIVTRFSDISESCISTIPLEFLLKEIVTNILNVKYGHIQKYHGIIVKCKTILLACNLFCIKLLVFFILDGVKPLRKGARSRGETLSYIILFEVMKVQTYFS